MSLRVYARINNKSYQVLGNNEFPQCLIDELKKQGAIIDKNVVSDTNLAIRTNMKNIYLK